MHSLLPLPYYRNPLGQIIPSSVAMCSVILTVTFPVPVHAQSKAGSNWYVMPAIAVHIVISVYISTRQRIWPHMLSKRKSFVWELLFALVVVVVMPLLGVSPFVQLFFGISSVLHNRPLYIVRYSVIVLAGILTAVNYTWDLWVVRELLLMKRLPDLAH
ncbi:hypothetical protein M422DRAFT_47979 [Sphaerobolus stellatus SS14]|uniref:Uncharacterized protein n=1 Tax=Sphaerobolus stellatus (strain SS14) TaxID=990650 RepID=A0A0C9VMM0_SPHS4|nr:hypothetical protein M422DRAFT_47979 [Sphaerobolus stellatus SS14]